MHTRVLLCSSWEAGLLPSSLETPRLSLLGRGNCPPDPSSTAALSRLLTLTVSSRSQRASGPTCANRVALSSPAASVSRPLCPSLSSQVLWGLAPLPGDRLALLQNPALPSTRTQPTPHGRDPHHPPQEWRPRPLVGLWSGLSFLRSRTPPSIHAIRSAVRAPSDEPPPSTLQPAPLPEPPGMSLPPRDSEPVIETASRSLRKRTALDQVGDSVPSGKGVTVRRVYRPTCSGRGEGVHEPDTP